MLLAVLATVALLTGGTAPRNGPGVLDIRIVRLYQQDGNKTRIKAFVDIPFAGMQADSASRLSLQAVARVSDSAGTTLNEDKWAMHPSAPGDLDELSSVQILDFAVAPGRYQLRVTVQDSLTGKTLSATASFDGFPSEPGASDLVLAPAIRTVTASDAPAGPGEWKYGDATLVTAAATVQLTPDVRTTLYYLIEAYSPKADSGTMTVTVVDSTGKTIVATKPKPLVVGAGGGVMKGATELAGLPEGQYQLQVDLAMAGQTVRRTAPFSMRSLVQAAQRFVADRSTDDGFFGAMRERELDLAEAPLIYIQKRGELNVYRGLSVAAKQKFLADFWRKRDPTPQTPINEARENFYKSIQVANQRYGEEGHNVEEGWRTDRGRIFLKQGDPRDARRRESKGSQPALWLWSYTAGTKWYIFADYSNNNVYRLVASNDLSEPGEPNWYDRFDRDSLTELGQFFGVDFFDKYQIPR